MRPSVAIVGVGGVGGVVGACLATAGRCDLTLLARGAGLERLRHSGLDVTRHDGQHIHCKPAVANAQDAAAVGPQDFVLWTTKAQQMPDSAATVAALCGPTTRVVPMQNGMPYWWFKSYGGPLEGSRLTADDHAVWRAVPSCIKAVHIYTYIGCDSAVQGEDCADQGREEELSPGKETSGEAMPADCRVAVANACLTLGRAHAQHKAVQGRLASRGDHMRVQLSRLGRE